MRNWIHNDWTVTIVGTMIGVLAAFSLNNWNEDRLLRIRERQALDKVREEVANNREIIQGNWEQLKRMYLPARIIAKELAEDEKLTMTPASMDSLRQLAGDMLTVQDSTLLDPSLNIYRYRGEMDMNLSILRVQLTDFAWSTMRNMHQDTRIGFDCLYQLEQAYQVQKELNTSFDHIWKMIEDGLPPGPEEVERLFNIWKRVIDMEAILLSFYGQLLEDEGVGCLP